MKKGIDISEWQSNVDYNLLKSQGIEFAIIRCGYGKNLNQKDTCFEKHYQGLKNAGIKIGCYLYSYCESVENAIKEAENCLNFIKGKSFDLPVFYDLEDKVTLKCGRIQITQMAIDFCKTIENAGYTAGIYASLNWYKNYIDISKLSNYKIWVAEWNGKSNPSINCDYWQYSSSGKVNGILGNVDMNYAINDLPNNSNNENNSYIGGDEPVRVYQNGSTIEPVYADINCTIKIGNLNKYEKCDCFGTFKNRAMVRYAVDNSTNYKIGFVKWTGGVK